MNAHLLNLLSLAAADLSRELGPGYLVCFDYGAHVREGQLDENGSLGIYLDGVKLHAVLQLFTSRLDGTPAESVAKVVVRAYEWLAVGRSLGAKEAAVNLDEQSTLRAFAKVLGVNERPCCCDVCWHTSNLCPSVLTDLHHDVCEAIGEELGDSLNHLRILSGNVCRDCWETDGEATPATETCVPMYGPVYHLCSRHYDDASEGAYERSCSEFYGGSGPSDQDRFEAARACGRKL